MQRQYKRTQVTLTPAQEWAVDLYRTLRNTRAFVPVARIPVYEGAMDEVKAILAETGIKWPANQW